MSDIAALRHLRPANAQPPLAWYFDSEIFALEKKLALDAGPNYVGHELMVPNPGDYRTLAQQAQQAAYLETAAEDGELCARVARGRRALYERGEDDAGPHQSPLEDTLLHFHEWLRARLGRPAAA